MSTVVVSVRIRREVKEELEKAGIDLGEAIRDYLEELALRVKARRMVEKWDKLLERTRPSKPGFSAASVREDRDSR